MRIGLTGGIGSGKSSAAGFLAALGAEIVDADAIAHRITATGGLAIPALREAFGDAALNGEGALDRAAMRALAFADPAIRARLEAVLHPLIAAQALAQADASDADVVVFDIPLLAESGHWRRRVDRVLVIDCREATQIERVARRPGWTEAAAAAVMARQATRAARRAVADAIVFNDGADLQALQAALAELWNHWQLPR